MFRRFLAALLAMCLLASMPLSTSAGEEELIFSPNGPAQEKNDEDKTEMDEFKDLSSSIMESLGQKDWNALAEKVTLTGDWRDDMTNIAQSQIGYQQEKDGMTIYTRWAGKTEAVEDWSVYFINWVADKAGLDAKEFPQGWSYNGLRSKMADVKALKDISRTTYPGPGDLALIEKDGQKLAGIVMYISNEYAAVVHGGANGRVAKETYRIGGNEFKSYVDLTVLMERAGIEVGKGGAVPEIPEEGIAAWTNTNAVYMRSQPTTASKRVTTIKKTRTALLVTSAQMQEDGYVWYGVKYQKYEGFIRGDLLDLDLAALPAVTPVPEDKPETEPETGCAVCNQAAMGLALPTECCYAHLASMSADERAAFMKALLKDDQASFVLYVSCAMSHAKEGGADLLCLGNACGMAAWGRPGAMHAENCPWHKDGIAAQERVVNLTIREAMPNEEVLISFETYGASTYKWHEVKREVRADGTVVETDHEMPGQHAASIVVRAKAKSNTTYSYYCVATVIANDNQINIASKETVLNVDAGEVVAQAILGEEIRFTYESNNNSNGNQAVAYQWYVQTADMAAPVAIDPADAAYTGANTATLTFFATLENSGAYFTCQVTYANGKSNVSDKYAYVINLGTEAPDASVCEGHDLCHYVAALAEMTLEQRHAVMTGIWNINITAEANLANCVLRHWAACHQADYPTLLCTCILNGAADSAVCVLQPDSPLHADECPWDEAEYTYGEAGQSVNLKVPAGAFNEDYQMEVQPVAADKAAQLQAAVLQSMDASGTHKAQTLMALDISFASLTNPGEKLQPAEGTSVALTFDIDTTGLDADLKYLYVYHIADGAAPEVVGRKDTTFGVETIEVNATAFSDYLVMATSDDCVYCQNADRCFYESLARMNHSAQYNYLQTLNGSYVIYMQDYVRHIEAGAPAILCTCVDYTAGVKPNAPMDGSHRTDCPWSDNAQNAIGVFGTKTKLGLGYEVYEEYKWYEGTTNGAVVSTESTYEVTYTKEAKLYICLTRDGLNNWTEHWFRVQADMTMMSPYLAYIGGVYYDGSYDRHAIYDIMTTTWNVPIDSNADNILAKAILVYWKHNMDESFGEEMMFCSCCIGEGNIVSGQIMLPPNAVHKDGCAWHPEAGDVEDAASGITLSGDIPVGVTLHVSEVEPSMDALDIMGDPNDFDIVTGVFAYDITPKDAADEKWQPETPVLVTVPNVYDVTVEEPLVQVFHLKKAADEIAGEGDYEKLSSADNAVILNADGSVSFLADGFSVFYVVAGTAQDEQWEDDAAELPKDNSTYYVEPGTSIEFNGSISGNNTTYITRNGNTITVAIDAPLGTQAVFTFNSGRNTLTFIVSERSTVINGAVQSAPVYLAIRTDGIFPSEPAFGSGDYKRLNSSYSLNGWNSWEGYVFSSNAGNYIDSLIVNAVTSSVDGSATVGVFDSTGKNCLKYLRNIDWDGKMMDAAINARAYVVGTTTRVTNANRAQYKVIPYVVKYMASNGYGWHIDCAVVPKDSIVLSYQLNLDNFTTTTNLGLPHSVTGIERITTSAGSITNLPSNGIISATMVGSSAKYQLKFLGWSTDPTATTPQYTVGQTVTVTESTVLYAIWETDEQLGAIKVSKVVSGLETEKDFTFTITREGSTQVLAYFDLQDGDDQVINNLQPGNYIITETTTAVENKEASVSVTVNGTAAAPVGTNAYSVTVADDVVTEVVFTNSYQTMVADLTITKVVAPSADGFAAPTGDTFTLTVSLPDGEKEYSIMDRETITIKDVPIGSPYTVKETGYPSYFQPSGPVSGTIDADSTKNAVTITNTYLTGSLTVEKVVEGTTAPEDAVFNFTLDLKDAKGGAVNAAIKVKDTPVSLTNGQYSFTLKNGETITFTGIPAGMIYTVTEAVDESKYTMTSKGATGPIAANSPASAVFTNTYKLGDLQITKKVNNSTVFMPETKQFKINVKLTPAAGVTLADSYVVEGATVSTPVWTKANGTLTAVITLEDGQTVTINDIPGNTTYEVTEEYVVGYTAAIGVMNHNTTANVIDAGLTDVVEVTNTYAVGSLKVTKTVVGETAPQGAKFNFTLDLKDAAGNPVNAAIKADDTDATLTDGQYSFVLMDDETITFTGIPAGTSYTVTETENADYSTDPADRTLTGTIEANKTAEAMFTNIYQYGELKVTKKGMQNDNENALVQVVITTPAGETDVYTLVLNNSSATITRIPVNSTYTVKEVDAWTWLYGSTAESTGEITLNNLTPEVTINNKGYNDKWLHDEGSKVNTFSANSDASAND